MSRDIYVNLDFKKSAQLLNARTQNVTASERTALAATLDASAEGLVVWDTSLKREFYWDGTAFAEQGVSIQGSVSFKGAVDASNAGGSTEMVGEAGNEYVVSVAGTLTKAGVTFSPSAVVEIGDRVIFASSTQAYVQQRNDVGATTTETGNVRLATVGETTAGTTEGVAVTPKGIRNAQYTRQYTATVDVSTAVGDGFKADITHGLSLVDRNSFVINAMLGNSGVQLDVDSIDANSLTVSSLVSLTGVRVTIVGASSLAV